MPRKPNKFLNKMKLPLFSNLSSQELFSPDGRPSPKLIKALGLALLTAPLLIFFLFFITDLIKSTYESTTLTSLPLAPQPPPLPSRSGSLTFSDEKPSDLIAKEEASLDTKLEYLQKRFKKEYASFDKDVIAAALEEQKKYEEFKSTETRDQALQDAKKTDGQRVQKICEQATLQFNNSTDSIDSSNQAEILKKYNCP